MPEARGAGPAPHTIGGQALIEGVMIRSPRWWAVAVRRPEGTIHTESHRVGGYLEEHPKLARPLIRGVLALGEAMSIGIRALQISARQSTGQETEIGRREMGFAVALALVFVTGLFVIAPALLVRGGGGASGLFVFEPALIVHNLFEGLVRIAIFLAYVLVVSLLPDIRRVFQYHGAEHKVISAFEHGEPTVEGARRFSTVHVRCGTNFLFVVMLLAVVVFSVVGRTPIWWRIVSRFLLLPVVAAISYEVLRIAARHERNLLIRAITWPGLLLQRVTTRTPDDGQVEVAVASLDELLQRETD